MFDDLDDLDDPGYAGPGDGARGAVAARAGRIRRNRRIAWTSGVASFLLVAVTLGAGLRSRPQSLVGIEPVSPVTPTAVVTSTPSPSATAEASPTPTPDRTTPQTKPAPRLSTSPVPAPQPKPVAGPSLRPGWSCAPAKEIPPEGGAMAPGFTLSLEAPATIDADKPGTATLVLTNGTDEHAFVRFLPSNRPGEISGPFQTVMTNGAGAFSGVVSDGARRDGERADLTLGGGELPAGESYRMPVEIVTWTCGAGGGRVPPGTYRMSVGIEVYESGATGRPTGSPSPSSPPPRSSAWRGTWATAAVTVTVR